MSERRPPNLTVHFRVGSVPVAVDVSFWVFTLVMGYLSVGARPPYLALWVLTVFFSVLVHELGHAGIARLNGARAAIRLHAFGGLTLADRHLTRRQDVLFALAGPVAGFAFGSLFWVLGKLSPPVTPLSRFFLDIAMFVNFGWGLINLLPIAPLDGSHVLAGILGPTRRRLVLLIGGIAGIVVILSAISGLLGRVVAADPMWMVILFGSMALQNFQAYAQLGKRARQAQEVSLAIDTHLANGWKALTAGEDKEAERIGELVLEHAPDAKSRNRARDLLAWVALARSSTRMALKHLERSEPPEAARALSWAMVLEQLDPPRALTHALRAVKEEPSETSASVALRLLVREKRLDEAEALANAFDWQRAGARSTALAEIEFARGQFEAAADHYRSAFEASGHAPDAYNAACSLARSGRSAEALEWLRRAVAAGFRDLEQAKKDPDLEAVRGLEGFARLLTESGAQAPAP